MLVLCADVVVGQHSHVLYLALVLFGNRRPESLLVVVQVLQTSLDGFDGLLVEVQVGKDHAFVDVGGSDRLVGLLKVFIEKALLDLQGHLQRLQSVVILLVLFVGATQIVETQRSQLQEFLLRTEIIPNRFVEQHVDALRDEIQLLGEV